MGHLKNFKLILIFFDKDLKCIKYAMEISNNDYEKASTEAKEYLFSIFKKLTFKFAIK